MKRLITLIVLAVAVAAAATSCKDRFKTDSADTSWSLYVVTGAADISGNGAEFAATLHGRVTDAVQNFHDLYPGLAEKGEIGFEYSTDPKLNSNVTTVGAMDAEGDGDDTYLWRGFRANINPLPPSTMYYYRAFIVLDGKKERGSIFSFRTDDAMVLSVNLDKHEETLTVPGGTLQLTATVYPDAALNKAVQWSSSQESIATVNQDGLVLARRPGNTDITVTTLEGGKTDVCHVTVKGPAPQAVDLGLSVKWADINVGAISESDYGSYFAWGEVATKNQYNKYNYKYNVDVPSPPSPPYVLPSSEDAASVNLGGNWRMPTKDEMQALVSSCTWERTSVDGINGWRVKGSNGKSIFLPYAGIWDDKQLNLNESGVYLTSTLKEVGQSAYEGRLCYVYALAISDRDDYEHYVGGYTGYYGHTIRAVCQ